MTAVIDGITVTGTPEEIAALIKLVKKPPFTMGPGTFPGLPGTGITTTVPSLQTYGGIEES